MKKKVKKMRSKGGPEHWSTEDYKVMVSWYRRPGDSKMPATKANLKAMYELTKTCRKDERSRLKPDEEPVVDDDAAEEECPAATAVNETAA
jgi:hypothetical protein